MLRREGWKDNRKKVERLYVEEKLGLEAFERPSTAFDAASWIAVNAAAGVRTGFEAAVDFEAANGTMGATATATNGVALSETGGLLANGTTDGADRLGDNDNKEGVVPKNGIPEGEALELALAAPTAELPTEGTEMWTDWTCAKAGEVASAIDRKSAIERRRRLTSSL